MKRLIFITLIFVVSCTTFNRYRTLSNRCNKYVGQSYLNVVHSRDKIHQEGEYMVVVKSFPFYKYVYNPGMVWLPQGSTIGFYTPPSSMEYYYMDSVKCYFKSKYGPCIKCKTLLGHRIPVALYEYVR